METTRTIRYNKIYLCSPKSRQLASLIYCAENHKKRKHRSHSKVTVHIVHGGCLEAVKESVMDEISETSGFLAGTERLRE